MSIKRLHYCKNTYFVMHESQNFEKFEMAPYEILKKTYFLCFSSKDLQIFKKNQLYCYKLCG